MYEEVVDGYYDITYLAVNDRRYRVYLHDGDVPTLFDTGYQETEEAVVDGIENVGVEPERLVITHVHDDHAGAFDTIVDTYDVETWVPEAEAGALDTEHGPDNTYEDGDEIGPWTAVTVAGHTPQCTAFVDESRGVAVTGDTVFGGDLRGFPTGYLLPPPALYNEDARAAERNLENLVEFEFDVALVFHGSSVLEDASETLLGYVDFPEKEPGMPTKEE